MQDNEDLSNRVREGKNSKIAWIGLVFCATSLYFIFNPVKCSAPDLSPKDIFTTRAPAENPKPTNPYPPAKERKEIRVQVDPVEWSGWVKIPVGYNWRVSRPGTWEEYWFWDGRKVRVEDESPRWFGDMTDCNFKIRGTKGEVVVTLEPK